MFGSTQSTTFGSGFGAPSRKRFHRLATPSTFTSGFGKPAASSFNTAPAFGTLLLMFVPSTRYYTPFLSGSTPSTGFNATSSFGGMNTMNPSQTNATVNQGTGNPSYVATTDKDPSTPAAGATLFHSVSAMPAYKNWSFEGY